MEQEQERRELRKRITKSEYELLLRIRENPNAAEFMRHLHEHGIEPAEVRQYWHKTKRFSIQVRPEGRTIDDVIASAIQQIEEYSPKPFKRIVRYKMQDPHCIVIDPADVHIGKLSVRSETGSEYSVEKAVSSVDAALYGILRKADGYNIEKVIFVVGNDILHIDTPKRTTTAGTPQDTDGAWFEAFDAALAMYVRAIEMFLSVCDVHVVYNPSNHDYMSGYMLAKALEASFRGSPNVTFDNSIRHRKYTVYGKNLIATSHGDGAKMDQMPLLMANEAPDMWALCPYRYVYLHHIHHKQVSKFASGKDYIGVTVEYLRSPSPSDGWHDRNGFVGAKKAIEAFVHSPEHGQVARITHHV
jgi:hypothetical protein